MVVIENQSLQTRQLSDLGCNPKQLVGDSGIQGATATSWTTSRTARLENEMCADRHVSCCFTAQLLSRLWKPQLHVKLALEVPW